MQQFGKYEVKRVLGSGASATVYLCVDSFTEAEVAIKVIKPDVMKSAEMKPLRRKQFLNEAALAGRLSHPHITQILDAAITEDSGHIVLEYVPGGDLRQWTSPATLLSPHKAVEIGFKCCGALDYAYREGIVHRDIKPANILVVSDTEVKISDFGSAWFQQSQSTQVADVGSPFYMSPEQITGDTLTLQTDMYCLGVVLYELLTGQRPFVAANFTDLIACVLKTTPAPPSAQRDGVPEALDAIVLRALGKRPAERYESWTDFALELAEVGHLSVFRQDIPESAKFAALRRTDMLREMSDAECWELVRAATWRRVPARTVVVREGDAGTSLMIVAAGQIKVTKAGRLLGTVDAGECLGEMGCVRRGELPRQATAETLTEALLADLPTEVLARLSDGCRSKLGWALLRTLVDRLALADVRIAQL